MRYLSKAQRKQKAKKKLLKKYGVGKVRRFLGLSGPVMDRTEAEKRLSKFRLNDDSALVGSMNINDLQEKDYYIYSNFAGVLYRLTKVIDTKSGKEGFRMKSYDVV